MAERVINLFGEVGKEITAKKFIDQLTKLGTGDRIEVNLYSDGGLAIEALAIYEHMLTTSGRAYLDKIDAQVVGMAGSAMTIIALALKAKIGRSSYFFVHNAYNTNPNNSTNTDNFVSDVNEKMKNIYIKHTGLDESKIVAIMNGETLMDATAAVELGFCSGLVEERMAIAADATNAINQWKGVIENRTINDYPQSVKDGAKTALEFIAKIGKGDLGEVQLAIAKQLANGEAISHHTFDIITSSDLPIYGNAKEAMATPEIQLFKKLENFIDMNIKDKLKAFMTTLNPKARFEFKLDDGKDVYIEKDGEEVIVGDEVYLADGSFVPDGTHIYGGKHIITVDGKVVEIRDPADTDMEAKLQEATALLQEASTEIDAKETALAAANATIVELQAKLNLPVAQRTPAAVAKVNRPAADKAVEKGNVSGFDALALKIFKN